MTNTANITRLTIDTVTKEALRYYIALQDWTIAALHSTDAERDLARYRRAAAEDALDGVDYDPELTLRRCNCGYAVDRPIGRPGPWLHVQTGEAQCPTEAEIASWGV